MSEATTTETPTTPTEGTTSSEAAATTLLSGTEAATTTTAAASDPAKPAAAAAAPAATEEAKPAAETKPESAGPPETYEFKAPEGKQYDSAVLEPFSAAAKEAGLTQDAAQKLLDTMAPKLAERQSEQVKAVQTGWLEASKSDKEFGNENLQANLVTAKKAYDTFATPELKTLLDTSGLGNHPEVIRLMVRIGKSLSEDGFVAGGAPKGAADLAAKLYPNTPAKKE